FSRDWSSDVCSSDLGGEIVKYTDERIENVGIENLRGISEYDPSVRTKAYGNMDRGNFDDPNIRYEGEEYFSDENHYFNFINISRSEERREGIECVCR